MKTDLKIAGDYLDLIVMHPASPEDVPGGEYFYEWDGTEEYSSRKFACSVEKQPDRDFVILNFADIQCHDGEAFCHVGEFSEETMDKLIRRTKPDLITLTGDNAFDPFAYLRLIDFLERYSVPWAPVMGNADHTGLVSEFWADYRMSHAKHCLFRCGPKGMGDGNYIINITENGRPVHTLFMMDSHHEETQQKGSYDHFTSEQLRWYEWAVKGIAAENGATVPSSVYMHIPVPEYRDAWESIHDRETGNLIPEFASAPFCKVHENYGFPLFNNGFFALCKKLGSTKNMLCGHDHKNCFSIPYDGITLTYAMKTGYGCYWERETNGGTTLTIRSDGSTVTEHHYIDPEESSVKMFMLEYYGKNLFNRNYGD